MFLANMNSFAC